MLIVRNKLYVILLIIALLFSIGENGLSYLTSNRISAVPHLLLATIVLVLLISKSRYLRFAIKLWSGIAMIGGALVFIGAFLFWLGGAPERIDYDKLAVSLAHILIGGMFYLCCDNSIQVTKSSQEA